MLVLSRQRDETIMIGDEIEITVVDIRGDKVRLGITAPTSIAVHRKEVYEAIRVENEQAARVELPAISGPIAPGPQKNRSSAASRLAAMTAAHPPNCMKVPTPPPRGQSGTRLAEEGPGPLARPA
jgi:carbon storage regulator